jgi:putative transposase
MKLEGLSHFSHFSLFGKRHLDYVLREFVAYYNTKRSSMVREHLPPVRDVPDDVETLKLEDFEVKSYVGGLVKSFERRAA